MTSRSSCMLAFLVALGIGVSGRARADDRPQTPLTARLFFGPAFFHIDVAHATYESLPADYGDLRGAALSTQLDVGARLTQHVGLNAVFLYDASKWAKVEGLVGNYRSGALGLGAGVDLRFLDVLSSIAMGWQATELTTTTDPSSSSSAKAGFVLARVGYTWDWRHGLDAGGHLFARYFWSRDEEDGSPRGYALGALLSLGFAGGKPLLR